MDELVLALLGHLGDFFVDSDKDRSSRVSDPSTCTVLVSRDLDFLAKSERYFQISSWPL